MSKKKRYFDPGDPDRPPRFEAGMMLPALLGFAVLAVLIVILAVFLLYPV